MIDRLSLRLGEGGSCVNNNDVKCDTNPFVNTPLVKLRLDLFNSDTLTSTHKAHVFQLHVHHSLSCVPLRQYRACVVDSLGLGITCVLYHCTICTRHPDLVSFIFYICHPYIPHHNFEEFTCNNYASIIIII